MAEKMGIPKQEFYAMNAKACNVLQEKQGIDKKYRLNENTTSTTADQHAPADRQD
jgi:hypothetical protein